MSGTLKGILIFFAVILVIALMAGSWVMSGYNRAITMDEAVKSQWAQVENQLKRRYDLIPNLVETVKGYAAHEEEIFTQLAEARTKYFTAQGPAARAKAATNLESALSRLLMLQERYPELKANESFLKLQDSLEGTENRIAVERKRYNDAVRQLNTFRRTLFGRFFTSLAGVEAAAYYEVPEAEKEAPQVKF
jgi:LemA protein